MKTKAQTMKAIHAVPACLNDGNPKEGIYGGTTCAAWVRTKEMETKKAFVEKGEAEKWTIHAVVSGPIHKYHRRINFKG